MASDQAVGPCPVLQLAVAQGLGVLIPIRWVMVQVPAGMQCSKKGWFSKLDRLVDLRKLCLGLPFPFFRFS